MDEEERNGFQKRRPGRHHEGERSAEPGEPIDPDELHERLEPFKRRVSADIRRQPDDD